MSDYALQLRWGLGPRVDPYFDARVGRAVLEHKPGQESAHQKGLGPVASPSLVATGYIELGGASPYQYLVRLLEETYDQQARGSALSFWSRLKARIHDRPNVWRIVRGVRYLTTDPDTGIALPLAGFNPDTTRPDWPSSASLQFQEALEKLNKCTGNKLQSARRIGLTVDFEFGVIAEKLRPIFRLGTWRRLVGVNEQADRARLEQILFGGLNPSLKILGRPSMRFDAQDIAISGGFNMQLERAVRELRDGVLEPPTSGSQPNYGMEEAGRGAIVGVVDFGCDFAHPSFRNETKSRILALWDQNAGSEPRSEKTLDAKSDIPRTPIVAPELPIVMVEGEPCRFGYGRVFTQQHIDQVLRMWQETCPDDAETPYAMLGYDPHDHHYTSKRPGAGSAPLGAHGTYVLQIAAGGRAHDDVGNPILPGVASQARIVFVQIRTHEQPDGRKMLDGNDVVDAVAFIFHLADREHLPCVVNLSLNTMSGPHDGDGHFERRLSDILKSGPAGLESRGRAVVIAAGNLPDGQREERLWQHITEVVVAGKPIEFHWLPPRPVRDQTRNSVEIWYDSEDAWLQVALETPGGKSLGPIGPGFAAELMVDGKVCGSIIGSRLRPDMRDSATIEKDRAKAKDARPLSNTDRAKGRHVILLEIDPEVATLGTWKITLEAVDQSDKTLPSGDPRHIEFHAWVERDDLGQSGINRANPTEPIPDRDRASSVGTLSCGEDVVVVGAYSTYSSTVDICRQSAYGPRRNGGIHKPDISAPGFMILLHRSKFKMYPADGKRSLESGTSLSAPFVAGTVACLYEAAPKAKLSTIKKALYSTARAGLGSPTASWHPQLGHGRLNPRDAVQWIRREGLAKDT